MDLKTAKSIIGLLGIALCSVCCALVCGGRWEVGGIVAGAMMFIDALAPDPQQVPIQPSRGGDRS